MQSKSGTFATAMVVAALAGSAQAGIAAVSPERTLCSFSQSGVSYSVSMTLDPCLSCADKYAYAIASASGTCELCRGVPPGTDPGSFVGSTSLSSGLVPCGDAFLVQIEAPTSTAPVGGSAVFFFENGDSSGCSPSASASVRLDVFSGTSYDLDVDIDIPPPAATGNSGSASGTGAVVYFFESSGTCTTTSNVTIDMQVGSLLPPVSQRTCNYALALAICPTGQAVDCISVCAYPGLTCNPSMGVDSMGFGQVSLDLCSGDVELRLITGQFTDLEYDVDGDARFNQLDVDELALLIGTTDADIIRRFNLAPDTAGITQEDVDVLQAIIDCGLGSGILGDADGDGLIECSDYTAANATGAFGGQTACQTGYVAELDADLDGDNDSADKALVDAVYVAANIARIDYNGDGAINSLDTVDFLTDFNNGVFIDYNGDGLSNVVDTVDFLADFNACT